MAFKKKYQYPALPAACNSYEKYFEREFKSRDLGRVYSYNVLTKRGNAALWNEVFGDDTQTAKDKKAFMEGCVVIQLKCLKTKAVVYQIYVESKFWYVGTKDRHDHDYIQSIANLHLDKLEGAIVTTKRKA